MSQFADQTFALTGVVTEEAIVLASDGFKRYFGRDEWMTIAVAADPTGKREERPVTTEFRVGRA